MAASQQQKGAARGVCLLLLLPLLPLLPLLLLLY
jgi:hypothetical protein